ncbi:MAG: OmpA family protein [Pseudomonadota bacterium]|nr:OmpA family protein [Pseudomonadota bacterium]
MANYISIQSRRALALGLISLCAACAGPNLALQQAQQEYAAARQDPEVAKNASVVLHEAEQALDQAEQAGGTEADVEHHAYIARKRVETARAEAERKISEAKAEQLLKEREQVVLEARTRQAKDATARAEVLAQELAALQAEKTDRGYVITLGDVLFEYDKANLKPGAQQNLYRLVMFLKEHPDQAVVIEGHTDSKGSDTYNSDLSQRRAQAVQGFLLSNGIGGERIAARGYGEAYPVASNDTMAGRQQNRRVEIVVAEHPPQVGHQVDIFREP